MQDILSANKLTSKYSCCISLGCECTIASSMQTIGIRSFSGPFDWMTSYDFPKLLYILETDFKDFMKSENLVPSFCTGGRPQEFTDIKYGFRYPHDVKESLYEEFPLIKQKYQKRINRFRKAIKKPTAFIRKVSTIDEVNYINCNRHYIEKVIKKGNSENEIIFTTAGEIEGLPSPNWGICFPLAKWDKNMDGNQLWHAFDSPSETHHFMVNLIAPDLRKANLRFYNNRMHGTAGLQKNPSDFLQLSDYISTNRDSLISFFSGRDWYVWGAGLYGNKLKEFLDTIGVRICGFIDSSPEKQGKDIGGIKICRWEDVTGGCKKHICRNQRQECGGTDKKTYPQHGSVCSCVRLRGPGRARHHG